MTYRYPDERKAHVRRSRFSLTGEFCWEAGKPGGTYLFGEGLHFDSWLDAIAYATSTPHEVTD
ncbi:MAG: hypothetical protein JWO46_754 [Nocardioidaceae bacterium]|nr:hypothetical protein [Nocardioidaceae bacterium]